MESIESETSIDSPDKEFAHLDLNDLDISNDKLEPKVFEIDQDRDSFRMEETSEKTTSKTSTSTQSKSPYVVESIPIPQIRIPMLDLTKTKLQSDSEDSKKIEDSKNSRTNSIEIKPHQAKVSPTPSVGSDLKSPRYDFNKSWCSQLSTFKPLNKAIIAPLKTSDSATSLGKALPSPRLDGVILSQGKSNDNVVVVYQFESQENFPKPIKSPLIPDMAARDMMERNKGDERRRLELSLQKELETIRVEFAAKERKMRVDLQEELREAEEKFISEKRMRLAEQTEGHTNGMEEVSLSFKILCFYQGTLRSRIRTSGFRGSDS